MDAPKISVLIPLYNRKHYIEQCINSVLIQTFQDFEIIVRDDGSSDGSADFVEKKYAAEISSGKIKLRRNEKNLGEFPTDNLLLREAAGKYVMILHSDDLYLPHALEHMYKIAEKYQADVVHGAIFLGSTDLEDDSIVDGTQLRIRQDEKPTFIYQKNNLNETELISDDPFVRFEEWFSERTFIDAQHNIFNKKFLLDNDILFWEFGSGLTVLNRLFLFEWIMKAKVFVKTFEPFYIYRNTPGSSKNKEMTPKLVKNFIQAQFELSRYLDKFFAEREFFKDKPELQYQARNKFFAAGSNHRIKRNKVYESGITKKLNKAVENAFKEYCGEDYAYLTFLFHWPHVISYKKPISKLARKRKPKKV